MTERFPTENDSDHITALAQRLTDTLQEYAREHGMTLPGVMSAIGTMTGALLARAYTDRSVAESVVDRVPIAAMAMIDVMWKQNERARARRPN
jgi:hypothetical protein